jgi:hypothetical protein
MLTVGAAVVRNNNCLCAGESGVRAPTGACAVGAGAMMRPDGETVIFTVKGALIAPAHAMPFRSIKASVSAASRKALFDREKLACDIVSSLDMARLAPFGDTLRPFWNTLGRR